MTSPLSILIADADETMRRILVATIREEAPTVAITEVTDGIALEQAVSAQHYDLVFLDVVLPQTNGAAVARWRAGTGPRSMVILLSDLLSPRWPTIATHLGAYDVLLKPIGSRQIRNALAAADVTRRTLTMLIVDPSRASRAVIRRLLDQSHFSFDILESEGGRRAINIARSRPLDLAIIEMSLPDFSALEVACQIQDKQNDVKLIMMGVGLSPETSRFDTFGVSGLLNKPFNFVDVDKAVHTAFDLWHPYLIKALQAEQAKRSTATA
ncbi:response regulator [Methylobacterium terrae]|uniref:Response regulator n=1 Tax=Methylobacterium terrae TaxID=2202827 RepID=A0A2U8WRD8_9HYPH|nr:response regulator [Methylobacterium terrae]AWN48667.1 response regulator [Methylobacterium terrae]